MTGIVTRQTKGLPNPKQSIMKQKDHVRNKVISNNISRDTSPPISQYMLYNLLRNEEGTRGNRVMVLHQDAEKNGNQLIKLRKMKKKDAYKYKRKERIIISRTDVAEKAI